MRTHLHHLHRVRLRERRRRRVGHHVADGLVDGLLEVGEEDGLALRHPRDPHARAAGEQHLHAARRLREAHDVRERADLVHLLRVGDRRHLDGLPVVVGARQEDGDVRVAARLRRDERRRHRLVRHLARLEDAREERPRAEREDEHRLRRVDARRVELDERLVVRVHLHRRHVAARRAVAVALLAVTVAVGFGAERRCGLPPHRVSTRQ